ncbi:hypothetical protein PAF15_01130 [Weissella koreensis]|uniref:hypothetical protein n=1 Tax=Weissella koreensis TaxID=165096 RepID=UPI0022BA2926|nr:hypothetical protein [Weissella koreensis]MCZ9310579.1 hypothetical protein [Weissella koreensis]
MKLIKWIVGIICILLLFNVLNKDDKNEEKPHKHNNTVVKKYNIPKIKADENNDYPTTVNDIVYTRKNFDEDKLEDRNSPFIGEYLIFTGKVIKVDHSARYGWDIYVDGGDGWVIRLDASGETWPNDLVIGNEYKFRGIATSGNGDILKNKMIFFDFTSLIN